MSLVNAWIAVKVSVRSAVKAVAADIQAAKQAGTELTAQQNKLLKLARELSRLDLDFYRKATIGADDWVLLDLIAGPEWVERFDEVIPSSVVAGCWNPDGTQYGQAMDPNGVVTGTPVYPIHPKLLDFMPDDVEYNADGSEKSRKRPTKLKQIHKYLGWADRRWS